jgi:hypothetical protein
MAVEHGGRPLGGADGGSHAAVRRLVLFGANAEITVRRLCPAITA